MTTTTLTPKQRQVLDLVNGGMKPADIARKLKISASGVNTHIRNLRAAGALHNGAATLAATPAAEPARQDGPVVIGDPAASLTEAIRQIEMRTAAIAHEVRGHQEAVSELEAESQHLSEQAERYRAALAALQ